MREHSKENEKKGWKISNLLFLNTKNNLTAFKCIELNVSETWITLWCDFCYLTLHTRNFIHNFLLISEGAGNVCVLIWSNEKVKHDNFSFDLARASAFCKHSYCLVFFWIIFCYPLLLLLGSFFFFSVHFEQFSKEIVYRSVQIWEKMRYFFYLQTWKLNNSHSAVDSNLIFCNFSSFMKLWNIHKLQMNR